jgi:hypothetical protein
MKRITKLQQQIIQNHLDAIKGNNFTHSDINIFTFEDMEIGLRDGQTFEGLHIYIVSKYVSITSQLYASPNVFGHITDAFRKDYTKGFKSFLNHLNIQ